MRFCLGFFHLLRLQTHENPYYYSTIQFDIIPGFIYNDWLNCLKFKNQNFKFFVTIFREILKMF